MQFTQVKETCLYIKDINRTYQFYHELLGLPVISRAEDRHIFFRLGTSVLLCFLSESTQEEEVLPPHFAYGKQHVAFEVEASEYERTKHEILDLGITITHEEKWREGVFSFYFDDPDGHVLEVVPLGMWE